MSRRRASSKALLMIAACAFAAAPALAQDVGDEPLRRLDASNLAGGDYGGTEPAPLAGGDYGREPKTEQPSPQPLSALIGDPLAAPPGGTRRFRRRAPEPAVEDDGYAPVGIKSGAFILRPSVETAGGYDDNPDRDPAGGKASKFFRLRGDLDAVSDWSRHEVAVRLTSQVRRYVDLKDPGYEPELGAVVAGRLDVSDRTQINTELRASLTTARPGDPDTPTNLQGDEIEKDVGATIGATQAFNRFSLRLEGLADRYSFNDPKLQNGTKVDNSDREYNGYEVRLRGAYELSPRLQPFAEIAADTRDYDRKFGDDGRRLGSDGYALRTGARFEASRLVTGEFAVGYGRQTPKDGDLETVGGLLVDGAVAWAPTGLTTVRFNAKTALQETTLAGSGGVLERDFGVAIEHRLRRNLIVTARADFERSSYRGIGRVDDGLTLSLEGEYRLNRTVSLIGSFQHERLDSNIAGEDYAASIIEVGMRVRR